MGRLENFLKESDTGLDIPAMIEECQDSINYLVFEIMALQRLEPNQKVVWAETLKTRIS